MACLSEAAKAHRKQRNHERYVEKRDEILAYQKAYRESNKEKIKARRRKRAYEQRYGKPYYM